MVALASSPRQQVMTTWTQWTTAQCPRLLHDPWPSVLPHPEGCGESCAANPGTSTRSWLAALAAIDELSSYRDLPTLTRRAVELLREAIGLERAAVFLLDQAGETLFGTFGTGPRGETTDERHISFALGQSHREAFTLAHERLAQGSRFAGVPLFAQQDDKTVVLRTGENVIVPIPGSRQSVGLVACDWALSGQAADTDSLLRTAVFTRVLGPLLERSDPAISQNLSNSGPTDDYARLAAQVVRRLQVNPNQARHELARQLGTTADRLGRAFKAALGESLQSYRNLLRLERFLAIVDPAGGDLLPAALDAGFGSYAQFHRVFRQRFDCSPVDYLRQRRR